MIHVHKELTGVWSLREALSKPGKPQESIQNHVPGYAKLRTRSLHTWPQLGAVVPERPGKPAGFCTFSAQSVDFTARTTFLSNQAQIYQNVRNLLFPFVFNLLLTMTLYVFTHCLWFPMKEGNNVLQAPPLPRPLPFKIMKCSTFTDEYMYSLKINNKRNTCYPAGPESQLCGSVQSLLPLTAPTTLRNQRTDFYVNHSSFLHSFTPHITRP